MKLGVLAASGAVLVAGGVLLALLGLDTPLLLALHRRAPGTLQVYLWSCVTLVGMGWCALILVLAADRGDGRLAALLAFTFLIGTLLTHLPKSLLHIPRPAGTALASQLHVIGDAFRGAVAMPSGHALTAVATAVLLWRGLGPRRSPASALLLAAAATLVAVSRVVVGAHWPSDVLVGAGLGLWAVVLALWLADRAPRRFEAFARTLRSPRGQLGIALVEIAAAVGLASDRTGYPAGQPIVALMAIVAVASAACRMRDLLASRAARRAVSTVESP
ncbi:phosphatase PAP2 family protein [Ramlibacter tataouinensis]|uniref:phosphatase PAP2 family protein n=1 Tax=Ramlibacter tataouinensis TaxID=94132 RepID=UPI0022F40320|nr:phosphatase PAP2 family protein [Ramlibacter tataouinensis]WBY02965.1 phosphatase PAP2 family protein [Ramlibacter tataouinensis]